MQNELVSLQSENSSLNGKLTKLGQACQVSHTVLVVLATRQLAGQCHSWCLLLVLQRLKRELSSCAIDKTKGDTEADRYRQQLSVVCMYVCTI